METWRVSVFLTPPATALMVTVPEPTPAAEYRPHGPTEPPDADQDTAGGINIWAPNWSTKFDATSCTLPPGATVLAAGFTWKPLATCPTLTLTREVVARPEALVMTTRKV